MEDSFSKIGHGRHDRRLQPALCIGLAAPMRQQQVTLNGHYEKQPFQFFGPLQPAISGSGACQRKGARSGFLHSRRTLRRARHGFVISQPHRTAAVIQERRRGMAKSQVSGP